MATNSPRPALASQAEKAKRSMGEAEKLVADSCMAHKERAINKESIIPSRQSRAERRWIRWNASPVSPSIKVEEKVK